MMKIPALLFCLFTITLHLSAQIPYPTQPKAGYYEQVKAMANRHIPDALELQAAKPSTLPAGLLDSLMKYDWYEISSYHYSSNGYSSYYKDILKEEKMGLNVQLPFKRFSPNKVISEMTLNRAQDGKQTVLTTTFDETNAQKVVEIKKVQNITYLVTEIYGDKESQQIVSLVDGILVMEIKDNPLANDLRKFRIAYRAVPKSF